MGGLRNRNLLVGAITQVEEDADQIEPVNALEMSTPKSDSNSSDDNDIFRGDVFMADLPDQSPPYSFSEL